MNKFFKILSLIIFIFIFISCSQYEHLYKITLKHGEKCGFINYEGKLVIPAVYSYVYDFSEGVACVSKDNKTFYINEKNKIVIIPDVNNSSFFSEGLAVASEKLKYGYINKKGKLQIPLIYDYANPFSNGVAWCEKDNTWYCINKNNKELFSCNYKLVNDFKNEYAIVVTQDKKKIIINKAGTKIDVPDDYAIDSDYVLDTYEVILRKNDKQFLLNIKSGKITEKKDKYLVFFDSLSNKYGLKDINNNILINAMYDYLSLPDDKGYVLCGLGDDFEYLKYGYLSLNGDIIIPIEFYQLDFFRNDMAVFQPRSVDGGYIRRDGKVFYAKDYL